MITGTVTSVEARNTGSELVADAAVGATTLFLDFVVDFDETGGTLTLNDSTYTYTKVDPDLETITLSTGLTAAAATSDFVSAIDAGISSVEWLARIAVADDEDTLTAVIPTTLVGFFPEGTYALPVGVDVDVVDDRYHVASQPERPPSFDGQVVWNPHSTRIPNSATIPDSSWTQLTSFTDVEVDGIQADTAGLTILTPGYYAYNVRVPFSASSPGRRRVRLMLNGSQIGFDSVGADDTTFTAVSINDARRFAELDVLTVEVSQNSGAGLALATTGAPSWSMYRVSV